MMQAKLYIKFYGIEPDSRYLEMEEVLSKMQKC